MISDDTPEVRRQGARRALAARAALIAWNAPDGARPTGCTRRPRAGSTVQDGAIAGGDVVPADSRRRTAGRVPGDFPHLAVVRRASSCPPAGRRAAPRAAHRPARRRRLRRRAARSSARPACRSPACSTTSTRAPRTPGSARRGAARTPRARRVGADRQGRRRCAARREPSSASRCAAGDDGVWRVERPAVVAQRGVRLRGPRLRAALDEVVTNVVTDPYSLGADARTRARSRARRPRRPRARAARLEPAAQAASSPSPRTRRSTSCTSATSRSPTRPCPAAHRGTYLRVHRIADSDGMRHLRGLAARRHEHRCTCCRRNDIATIEEDRARAAGAAVRPRARSPPDSERAAGVRRRGRATPTASTGATTRCTTRRPRARTRPTRTAPARTREFREMVTGVNRAGLRVVHGRRLQPHAGGRAGPEVDPRPDRSRLLPAADPATGAVETSTCCSNTATEHRMMEKLMVDSVVTWATQYKVDGFRFDLMGHHPKANMLDVRRALDALTLQARRRRRQADLPLRRGLELRRGRGQRALRPGQPAQHGRHRDRHVLRPAARRRPRRRAVRRGPAASRASPAACTPTPTAPPINGTADEQRARLLHYHDQIKVGLAGNLRDYRFVDRTGADRHRARRSTTTASPPATPPSRARRSPTSTRTTTRRCSTRCSTSCRRPRRWPTGCG